MRNYIKIFTLAGLLSVSLLTPLNNAQAHDFRMREYDQITELDKHSKHRKTCITHKPARTPDIKQKIMLKKQHKAPKNMHIYKTENDNNATKMLSIAFWHKRP